jgi:hypothetical protein
MPGNPALTTFAVQTPPWSLAQLDANFTAIAAVINSANNYSTYLADTGGVNALTVSFSAGVVVTLAAGLMVAVKPANANTGACTLNVNGTGVKNIKKTDNTDPIAGEITTTGVFVFYYDGTNYVLLNPAVISSSNLLVPVRQTVLAAKAGGTSATVDATINSGITISKTLSVAGSMTTQYAYIFSRN